MGHHVVGAGFKPAFPLLEGPPLPGAGAAATASTPAAPAAARDGAGLSTRADCDSREHRKLALRGAPAVGARRRLRPSRSWAAAYSKVL